MDLNVKQAYQRYTGMEKDGLWIYYDKETKATYTSQTSLNERVGTHHLTLDKVVEGMITGGALTDPESAEVLTAGGIKVVRLIPDKDIARILLEYRDRPRVRANTKAGIDDFLGRYAASGFRLTTLLALAPQELVYLGIENTEDPDDLDRIIERAEGKKAKKVLEFNLLKAGITKETEQGYKPHAITVNRIYIELFDMKAEELRKARNIPPSDEFTRDHFTSQELSAIKICEEQLNSVVIGRGHIITPYALYDLATAIGKAQRAVLDIK
jgi:hypothetical protein